MNSKELRTLTDHVARAHAGLTALAHGFEHDGVQLPGRDQVLARALESLAQAARIARDLPRQRIGAPAANKDVR